MRRRLGTSTLLAITLAITPAFARDEEGVPITIHVVDASNSKPIPNAWVRVPDTEGRRRVDPASGSWTASYLYTYDGAEYFFLRGMMLEFTISAPGYSSKVAQYRVKARRNELTVALPPIEIEDNQLDTEIDWFKRNLPDDSTDSGSEPVQRPEVEPDTAAAGDGAEAPPVDAGTADEEGVPRDADQ